MPSILPQIEQLHDIPFFHAKYAEALLKLLVSKTLSMEELEIGTFVEGEKPGSCLMFDDDDFENVTLELRYVDFDFVLLVNDHSEDMYTSSFKYKIQENSLLYRMIPDGLRSLMISKADESDD